MRSFEVFLSWFSYVTGEADPSLHANPLRHSTPVVPSWLCLLRSDLSQGLLCPDLDQPGLAPSQGLCTKYSEDNVMFSCEAFSNSWKVSRPISFFFLPRLKFYSYIQSQEI